MHNKAFLHRLQAAVMLVALLLSPLQPVSAAVQRRQAGDETAPVLSPAAETGLYRTRVTFSDPARRARIDKLGIRVLTEGTDWATVLADGDQLETLARLRFEPRASDELGGLIASHAEERPWLAESLRPLLEQAAAVQVQRAAVDVQVAGAADQAVVASLEEAKQSLRAAVGTLSPEQAAGIADLVSDDTDGDGLTNTEEAWWCTDPADTDTDDDGRTDGAEIQALEDWMANKRSAPPGETPWPNWPFNDTTCPDKDHDSIPNLAERYEMGLNMDWESIDRDKFDDGQELFGVTYCPGGDLSCGYGDLPRSADSGYVGATMPSWVKAPGKHPLVAAFPVPEVDVVESSLHVQTVTTVTTDHSIASGIERSYSTTKTEGSSKGESDTQTWNEWEESYETQPLLGIVRPSGVLPPGWGKQNCTMSFPPGPWTAGCVVFTTAADIVADTCIKGGGYSLEQCKRGAQQRIQSAKRAASQAQSAISSGVRQIADGFRVVKTGTADIAGRTKDWIDKNLKLESCSVGLPLGISCTVQFQGGTRDADGGRLEKQTFSGSSTDQVIDVGGKQFRTSSSGPADLVAWYPMGYPASGSVPSRTEGGGRSWGGSRTTTQTWYEEQSVTNGEAFSSEESWGDATAVDSAHAADLWFTYKVRNTGTEYAKEIAGLAFNVFIGDDPDPIYTYFIAPDLGGDGAFHNFMPGEEHAYTARHIPLSLEQMKAIDLGGPLFVIMEDFTYGADELFYQDAANAGVMLAMEDGTDDGDEAIDTYLFPTWGTETVLDVLARYFPHTVDENGALIAVWTPEYRADTPAWCNEPQVVGIASLRTLWCKHALSTADWWNIYTDGMGDGSEGFQDTLAAPGQTALFRFNQDTDLDGYSDRSEARLGTDPADPASHPGPELISGVHSIQSGNQVVATLSLLNTGLYDAYGVEAVMIAPNDTISITNNTVGGSGRVRSQKQVIVGSRILLQSPLPAAWLAAGHAQPAADGYYEGTADRTYTFTVSCANPTGCDVGADAWTLNWSDGAGEFGSLAFGAGYNSPNLLAVGRPGVKLGLLSGHVANGESFSVEARTPRDTFQFEIAAGHEGDYTPPIVLVSYNDPQGNHRFVLPPEAMALGVPSDDLLPFSGQMLPDPGVEIVTSAPFAAGPNTPDLLVNNPTETTLADALLFLEFVDPAGTVTEEVSATVTLEPGPTVRGIAFDTADFDPAYDPAQDYIVMAFLTDYQGNILDTAARPLSSFQEDPRPASAMAVADETWDFGTAPQGTLMQRAFTLASVGYADLLAHLGTTSGLSVEGPASRSLAPADTAAYTVTLNTQALAVGPYLAEIPVRTSDPAHPERTITIQGTITEMPPDTPGGATIRPLDLAVSVPAGQSAGTWYEYVHTLEPDAQTLHPVKVWSQDYGTLKGIGRYSTDFGQGTASYEMFGDGRDGVMPSSGNLDNNNGVGVGIVNSGSQGSYSINVTDAYAGWRINSGDAVLIHQTQGTGAGCWELNKAVSDYSGGTANIQLAKPLQCNYASGGNNHAQIQRVPQYIDCPVSGTVTPLTAWNGSWGGVFAVMCSGSMTISGSISTSSRGYRGGVGATSGSNQAQAGEGETTIGGWNKSPNGEGGGGGGWSPPTSSGGIAFQTDPTLTTRFVFGGGGGGGTPAPEYGNNNGATGGIGGGLAILLARSTLITGNLLATGGAGVGSNGKSGGGGGGGILVKTESAAIGDSRILAIGGAGISNVQQGDGGAGGAGAASGQGGGAQSQGGAGGDGRVRIEYCNTLIGTTNPPASSQKLNCYIVEQIESDLYTHGRLNLPEDSGEGKTYKVQYGRRYQFGLGGGNAAQSIRVPKQLYATATLDALVSNTGISSGALNLSLDVGDNSSPDWTHSNPSATFPVSYTVTSLATAINHYMISRTDVAWGADVDVPVRVQIDHQADVILTNLVLTLQSNQPDGAMAASVDMGADRPLDWTEVISGDYSLGAQYDFTHPLIPEPESIQPCKVYDQTGSTVKGVGKYCADFGEGSVPTVLDQGNGSSGALVVSTVAGESTDGQSHGSGNPFILPLDAQYTSVWIKSGAWATATAWDGSSGGRIRFRATGQVTVDGTMTMDAKGYRGGPAVYGASGGRQGESYPGLGGTGIGPNGGGGGAGNSADGGGGGGGYGTPGGLGLHVSGVHSSGGEVYGDAVLTNPRPGSGGGSSGAVSANWGAKGGNGGGAIEITAAAIAVNSVITAVGENGGSVIQNNQAGNYRGGGGGSGGSILLRGRNITLGETHVVAYGGSGGYGHSLDGKDLSGGTGGAGRIHVEYCNIISGSTNPSTTPEKLNCYAAEQVDGSPSTTRLYIPEQVTGGVIYLFQYGRRYSFAGASSDTKSLRLKRQMYSSATLDALVSDTGVASGALNLSLDIGADGTADWTYTNADATFPATLPTANLASALNAYLLTLTDDWGADVDVPFKVTIDCAADVMLTNLALTPVGAKTRFLRLLAEDHTSVTLSVQFGSESTPDGPLAYTVDVGADGTVDWQAALGAATTYPAVVTSPDLAAAFNAYLAGRSGDVDVPVRITPSPSLETALHAFTATPSAQPDLSVASGDIELGAGEPVEGDDVTVMATIHNPGEHASGPVTASFFASTNDWGEWYIGSAFIPNVPAEGTATAQIVWNTLGFTGTVPVRVSIDPYNRLAETNEENNSATKNITVKTRPDLGIPAIALSDPEPVSGETVTVTVTERNAGQTATGAHVLALYDGNPDAAGTLIGEPTVSPLAGSSEVPVEIPWTPTVLGPHRLFIRTDRDAQVNEYDEGNNDRWHDVYVGFGAPVALDSGTPAADPTYAAALGYGAVDTGLVDVNVTCADHTDTTLRRDPSNRVGYRFDHLQPGRSYHLDIVLYECDNNQRQERVFVDGMLVAGPVDLGDQRDHAVSERIDPALYRDHAIEVAIVGEEGSQRGAVAASVALREIDYRYADSGTATDLPYTSERGWGYLDANSVAIPGTLPYRSVRVDQDDAELRYQFDRLVPGKRYQVHLTFWQATGNPLLQRVYADGLDTGATVNLVAGVPVSTTLRLSPVTYKDDGSVVISIQVLNAGTGALVNEIALEEETLLTEAPCADVRETPNASIAFGYLTINGAPAPTGTVVTAESPRGELVGCYVVDTAGQYGFMSVYGEDSGASPPIPGMTLAEFVIFRVDGAPATATPTLYWQNDQSPHQVDLNVVPLEKQGILLQSGWNLVSFRVEPVVPVIEYVLQSISGKYGRVLDENEIWDKDIPAPFRTLKELHGGRSYYLRVDGGSSAYLLVEGTLLPVATELPLHSSWNWPGYLPASALDVAVALQSISGSYQRVLSLNQYYDVRYPTFSTLKQMAPNQGYRIYATQAATLVYPSGTEASPEEVGPTEVLSPTTPCDVSPTPELTLLFGQLTIDGQPAPTGTLVEAVTPRGEVAGCYEVDAPGQYGFMSVYGEDPGAEPPIPGFRSGEPIIVRVNGREVTLTEEIQWQNDLAPHQVDLTLDLYYRWLPLVTR